MGEAALFELPRCPGNPGDEVFYPSQRSSRIRTRPMATRLTKWRSETANEPSTDSCFIGEVNDYTIDYGAGSYTVQLNPLDTQEILDTTREPRRADGWR